MNLKSKTPTSPKYRKKTSKFSIVFRSPTRESNEVVIKTKKKVMIAKKQTMVSVSDLLSFKSSSNTICNNAGKAYTNQKNYKIDEGPDVDIGNT